MCEGKVSHSLRHKILVIADDNFDLQLPAEVQLTKSDQTERPLARVLQSA